MPSRNSRSPKKLTQAVLEELEDVPEDAPDGVDPDDDDAEDGDYVADAEQEDSESDDQEVGVSDISIDFGGHLNSNSASRHRCAHVPVLCVMTCTCPRRRGQCYT